MEILFCDTVRAETAVGPVRDRFLVLILGPVSKFGLGTMEPNQAYALRSTADPVMYLSVTETGSSQYFQHKTIVKRTDAHTPKLDRSRYQ